MITLNSIDELKEDRLNDAISYFKAFKKAYPNSEYMEDAIKMNEELEEELRTFSTKS